MPSHKNRIILISIFFACTAIGFGQDCPYYTIDLLPPVQGDMIVNSPFATPRTNAQGKLYFHPGVDILVPNDTEVLAMYGGHIEKIDDDPYGYGHYMVVDHENEYKTLYAHLNPLSDIFYELYEGKSISQGDTIAISDSGGSATGPHLHAELMWSIIPEDCPTYNVIRSLNCIYLDPIACWPLYEIQVSPGNLTLTAEQNGEAPPAQTLTIQKINHNPLDNGTVYWSASSNQDWLNVTPTSGDIWRNSNSQLSADIVSTDLPSGQHTDTITINSSNSVNSPITIPVTLNIEGANQNYNIAALYPIEGYSFRGAHSQSISAYVEPASENIPPEMVVEIFANNESLGERSVYYVPPYQYVDSTGEIVTEPAYYRAFLYYDVPNIWNGTVNVTTNLKMGSSIISQYSRSYNISYNWDYALCGLWQVSNTIQESYSQNVGSPCNQLASRTFTQIGNGELFSWFYYPYRSGWQRDYYINCDQPESDFNYLTNYQYSVSNTGDNACSGSCGEAINLNEVQGRSIIKIKSWPDSVAFRIGLPSMTCYICEAHHAFRSIDVVLRKEAGSCEWQDNSSGMGETNVVSNLYFSSANGEDYPSFTFQRIHDSETNGVVYGCEYSIAESYQEITSIERSVNQSQQKIAGEWEDNRPEPTSRLLINAYPNPFNSITTVGYFLSEPSVVIIDVYNVLGQKIDMLVNQHMSGGYYEVAWDAQDVPSGIYFCRIQAGEYTETRKMLLLR